MLVRKPKYNLKPHLLAIESIIHLPPNVKEIARIKDTPFTGLWWIFFQNNGGLSIVRRSDE